MSNAWRAVHSSGTHRTALKQCALLGLLLNLSMAGGPASAIQVGSLTVEGTLTSASGFETGTQISDLAAETLALGLGTSATFPRFGLAGYTLTDVFVSFTLSHHSTASISSYDYLDATHGHTLEVSGSLGAVLDSLTVAAKVFDFSGDADLSGCAQEIDPEATIACAASDVSESGSLSFEIATDDLSAFIGAGNVEALASAGSAFTFGVSTPFFHPIDGRIDGTIQFDALRIHYGYICLKDLDDLDACRDSGDDGGEVPEPGSIFLLAAVLLAVRAVRTNGLRRHPPSSGTRLMTTLLAAAISLPLTARAVTVEGTVALRADTLDLGAFGLSFLPPDAFLARFRATYVDSAIPDPKHASATLDAFDLEIGTAHWDESMPHGALTVLLADGLIKGMETWITSTTPHPDLSFFLPASAGRWVAHDLVGDLDHGSISGTYEISDQTRVVPEPVVLVLVLTAVLMPLCRYHRFPVAIPGTGA